MIDQILSLSTPLLMLSALPQTSKLIKTKSSQGISKLTYLLTWLGVFLLAIDSYQAGDFSLALTNSVSFTMLTVNLILIFIYATPKR